MCIVQMYIHTSVHVSFKFDISGISSKRSSDDQLTRTIIKMQTTGLVVKIIIEHLKATYFPIGCP